MFYNKKIFERIFYWDKKHWYRNIKEIPRYFKSMRYLVKHGYDEYATFETFNWFIDTMTEILTWHRFCSHGTPILIENFTDEDSEKNKNEWNSVLDKLISLFRDMDESNPKYDNMSWKESDELRENVKNEFFKLFSKYFYNLWD